MRFVERVTLGLALAVSVIPTSGFAQGTPPEPLRSQILAPVEGFLEGLRDRNADLMSSNLHPAARMTLLRPKQGGGSQLLVLTADQFIQAVLNPDQPRLEEPVRNTIIENDDDLATVWAEYQVRNEAGVSHCGYDAIHLIRTDGSWKILNVSDTFRRVGCGEAWPGDQLVR